MTWNYRVIKYPDPIWDGDDWYSIGAAYYNKDGSIYGIAERVVPCGDTPELLAKDLRMMLKALSQPVLVDGEVVFKERDWRR